MRRVLGAAACAALLTTALAACGTSDSGSSASNGEYRVGFVASLSGAGSVFADQGLQSAKLAVDEINKGTDLKGHRVKLIQADDAADPKVSQQVCNRLIASDKVDVIVGFQNSADRQGCLPVATRAGIPYIYTTSYEGHTCAPNFFVTGEVPEQQVTPLVDYMATEQGSSKWFLAGSNYIAMTGGNKFAAGAIKDKGGTVVGNEYAPIGTTDFTPLIQRIVSSGADTLLGSFLGSDAIAFLKQWNSSPGTKGIKMATFGIPIGAGDAVKNMYTAFSYFPNIENPKNDAYKAALKQMFGSDAQSPTFLSVVVYDGVWMWAKAAAKAGTADGGKVIDALHNVSFDGPRGPLSFNAEGHASLPMYVALWNGDPLGATSAKILKSYSDTDPGKQC